MSKIKKKFPGIKSKKDSVKTGWFHGLLVFIVVVIGLVYVVHRSGRVDLREGAKIQDFLTATREVQLYFGDPYSGYLKAEKRRIPNSSSVEKNVTRVVRELIKGPRGSLIRTLPPDTELNKVHIDGKGVAWLDFTPHLSRNHPGGSSAELMTVYSIVNTVLLNNSEVAKVKILIEGKTIETIAGHIDCNGLFTVRKEYIQ